MHQAGEVELARIWTKVEQIRAKQAAKPKHSPLPTAAPVAAQEPDGWVTKDLLFPSLHRKPHRALYLREVPEDVTGIEDLRGRTWEGKTAYEIKPFYFASQPAQGEPAGWRDFLVRLGDLEGSMVNGNRLSRAAKDLLAAAPTPPETWKVLPSPALPAISAAELAAFHRFCDCCEDFDSGGYDVPKDMMSRLARIGVVRSCGFGRHETTEYGDAVRALIGGSK
jgi:hypothetical protein